MKYTNSVSFIMWAFPCRQIITVYHKHGSSLLNMVTMFFLNGRIRGWYRTVYHGTSSPGIALFHLVSLFLKQLR